MPSATDIKTLAWNNAQIVSGYNPATYRKDACGAWIAWDKYGVKENLYGWEIDHIYPQSKGGTTIPQNIRALNCKNNESKGDSYPLYTASLTSHGDTNTPFHRTLTVNATKRAELSNIYHI